MVRIDAWEVSDPEAAGPLDCGFPRTLEGRYAWGRQLGKGGFGTVRVVTETASGKEFACKSIVKRLDAPNFSPQRQAAHLDNIKREVAVLRKLAGTLNVAQLREALEDAACVHIVMEYCRGGELWNVIGKLHHYSERTVASYMRAVLRTVAQCHSQRILHRDVKPGNFMLLAADPLSPVKAIDFGLAVFFEPGKLPRRDLGLEGTPWFMAPEALSSQVGPPADVWACGVMAYQLLSGHLPFNDWVHPDAPALSKVWRAILTEEVAFKSKAWREVSAEARDFVRALLAKDPAARPSARAALQHAWLLGGRREERCAGAPLRHTVVQRIQRFGQGNAVKRTLFELIAQEIIKAAPETPEPSQHSARGPASPPLSGSSLGKREADGSGHASARAAQLVSTIKRRKSARALAALAGGPGGGAIEGPPLPHREHRSVHGGLEYFSARGESVHGGRQALAQAQGRPGSVHGRGDVWQLLHAALQDSVRGRNSFAGGEEGRREARKAARLALDTSEHSSRDYAAFLRQASSPSMRRMSEEGASLLQQLASPPGARQPAFPVPEAGREATGGAGGGEERVRGRSAYRAFLESQQGRGGWAGAAPMEPADAPREGGSNGAAAAAASPDPSREGSSRGGRRHVSFSEPERPPAAQQQQQQQQLSAANESEVRELRELMRNLHFTRDAEAVSTEALAEGLRALGYQLPEEEVRTLLGSMQHGGQAGGVSKSAFLASQIDWHREDVRELWLEAARRVFADLETGSRGRVSAAALAALVREKVPEAEVEAAIEDALLDAGYTDAEADERDLDFDAFMRMLRPASSASLDQFEPRIALPASQENLAALPPVREEA